MHEADQVTYFAETDFRNARHRFGIKAKDRTRHVYVIGKTGMGKSTLLENMAVQDIQNGNGLAFLDPHGGSAEKLLEYIPESRVNDVVYFAPFDMDYPISFNVMEDVGYDKRHLVVSGLMSAFEKIWADAWSARMSYILQNTLYALLEYPESTLLDINRMLVDKEFRKRVVENIKDPSIKSFWVDEFAKYSDRYTQDATPAIQNKVGQFVSNPVIRNIIGQPKSSFDVRRIMDEKKIMIVNLSKGRIGESNTNLLGSILVTKIYLSAMSRADLSAAELAKKPNFYLYVDEFQSFANKSFADILSEARKYKLNLTIAHQYVEQMEEEVRSAVFGNVGTMIVFRVGSFDAEIFEKEFAPQFTAEDIVNLGFAQIYLRLMIDGIGSKPFSAVTTLTEAPPADSFRDAAIAASRAHFAHPRAEVEELIRKRLLEEGKEDTQNRATGEAPRAPRPREPDRRYDDRRHPTDRRDQRFGGERPRAHMPPRENNQQVRSEPPRMPLEEKTEEDRSYASLTDLKNNFKPGPQPQRPPHSQKQFHHPHQQERVVNEQKSGNSANRDALRSALAGVLEKEKQSQTQKPQTQPTQEKKENNQRSTNEVPEDVLKKVLE